MVVFSIVILVFGGVTEAFLFLSLKICQGHHSEKDIESDVLSRKSKWTKRLAPLLYKVGPLLVISRSLTPFIVV